MVNRGSDSPIFGWQVGRQVGRSRKSRAYNRAVDFDPKDEDSDDSEQNIAQNGTARAATAGRVMGLDVGSRRIGVAVSDPRGITAQGLDTLQRTTKRRDFEELQRVIQEYDVREIVVGLPLRDDGMHDRRVGSRVVVADKALACYRPGHRVLQVSIS